MLPVRIQLERDGLVIPIQQGDQVVQVGPRPLRPGRRLVYRLLRLSGGDHGRCEAGDHPPEAKTAHRPLGVLFPLACPPVRLLARPPYPSSVAPAASASPAGSRNCRRYSRA